MCHEHSLVRRRALESRRKREYQRSMALDELLNQQRTCVKHLEALRASSVILLEVCLLIPTDRVLVACWLQDGSKLVARRAAMSVAAGYAAHCGRAGVTCSFAR